MKLLTGVRLLSLGLFLYHTVSIHPSWMAVVTGAFFVVTLYGFTDRQARPRPPADDNPLKGKPRGVTHDIPTELKTKIAAQISDMVTYDAETRGCLSQFEVIQSQTECLFAKKAKLWGSDTWDDKLHIEQNIYRSLPTLLKFVYLCPVMGLDGFVFTLPGRYGANVQMFGDAVRRVLTTISDHDPSGIRCMDKNYIGRRGWVFQFNKCTMFVTTFAPCYPSSHSRYAFGSGNCFVLLQPEVSFAQHDLCPDTPHTNWDSPKTARDRIRVGFRDARRPYVVRNTVHYPMAEDIVKPVEPGVGCTYWWKKGVHEQAK